MNTYLAIDLKSFYASVECVARGLNPLTTNLVVADPSRTDRTICLAVSPSLKSYGIPGRARLYAVKEKVKEINKIRKSASPIKTLTAVSVDNETLKKNSFLALDFIIAPPRMQLYIDVSCAIYDIYAEFFAPEDIHIYSIDEVFIDATHYLKSYGIDREELVHRILIRILEKTGITATAGIGTNLYLAKIAMDIVAKHKDPDENGSRIAFLDEKSFMSELWDHLPLTDFWRIGPGTERRLNNLGIKTIGDLANYSKTPTGEQNLYKTFGKNAELLIDHAFGIEPVTIKDIKNYTTDNHSLTSGQVLHEPYTYKKLRIVISEMLESLVLDLFEKNLVTDQIVIYLSGSVDFHSTINLKKYTNIFSEIIPTVLDIYDKNFDRRSSIFRINLVANHVKPPESVGIDQKNLFIDYDLENKKSEREQKLTRAIIDIKNLYGKNAILRATSLEPGSTIIERNNQIGGHKA